MSTNYAARDQKVTDSTSSCWGVTTYRNGPERTGTDRNGHTKIPKQTSMGTETDRNGL